MADFYSSAVKQRELERAAIQQQVREYLERGGIIEQLPLHVSGLKPVGPVWRASSGADSTISLLDS